MKAFKDLILCCSYSEKVDVHVRATLAEGALTIEGQDLGPVVEQFWGDEDYEYWYQFDPANTAKLFRAIGGEEDPASALLREFSGVDGCKALRDVCGQKGIEYRFFSYA